MAIDASDVIVFKTIRFRVSTLIRYVCVFICIHFQQRFQIDAFSVNTLSVFERISVDGRPKRIEMYAFSNENALYSVDRALMCGLKLRMPMADDCEQMNI